jgi:hypothetical protein
MSVYYTSEQLIDSVKRRINIPTNQNTFTNTDILAFADEELGLGLVPAIMSLHEDYLLFSEDVPLVEGKTEYEIPYRAVGNKLYDLQFIDNNGNVLMMSRTTLADQDNYNGYYTINRAYAYYVKNNRVGLLPPNANGIATGSLRFIYFIRPSSLVLTPAVGVITGINRTTGDINVSSLPNTFNLSTLFDFYKVKSPHNIYTIDNTATGVNSTSNTITFDPADIPDSLSIGDHVALSQQCAIPQIPSDLHVFLAQKTGERILESQGDMEGLKLAQAKSAEMEVRAGTIIDNRVDESPIKLVNRQGILRSGLFNRRRG